MKINRVLETFVALYYKTLMNNIGALKSFYFDYAVITRSIDDQKDQFTIAEGDETKLSPINNSPSFKISNIEINKLENCTYVITIFGAYNDNVHFSQDLFVKRCGQHYYIFKDTAFSYPVLEKHSKRYYTEFDSSRTITIYKLGKYFGENICSYCKQFAKITDKHYTHGAVYIEFETQEGKNTFLENYNVDPPPDFNKTRVHDGILSVAYKT